MTSEFTIIIYSSYFGVLGVEGVIAEISVSKEMIFGFNQAQFKMELERFDPKSRPVHGSSPSNLFNLIKYTNIYSHQISRLRIM